MTAINYTNRDFDSIRQSLAARIRTEFPDSWRDFTESQIGIAWLELVAHVFDILSFYTDEMVRQQFLGTATDREAVILLTSLVGYKMRAPTSASVVCVATLPAIQGVDVVIRAGTQFDTPGGITFEVLEDQQIFAGSLTANITLVEGATQQDTFVSNGAAFQEFKLLQTPVIEGSLKVTVDGFEWDVVDSLVFSGETTTSFSVRTDVDDFAYVKFGDGSSGAIPAAGANIFITYRVGGGVRGNIALNEITIDVQGLLEGSAPESFVNVALVNEERGSGGEDRETIESAKFWAPRTVTANGRAVTEQDFDTLASRFSDPVYGAPAFAKAKLKQRIPELNTVQVFLWARDGYGDIVPPSDNLKSAVQSYFSNNGPGAVRIITVDVEVEDGVNVFIDVDALVTADGTKPASEVLLAVQQSLRSYFSNPVNQPGTNIRLSRLYNLIQTTPGVDFAIIRRVTASVLTTESVGVSDGITTMWTYTTFNQPLAGTIIIQSGPYTIRDDGHGNLIGDVDPLAGNTVDYSTGAVSFVFPTPVPDNGEGILIDYRYPLEYQRSEAQRHAGNSTQVRFRGQLTYFPIVPDTVAFTDGFQTISDNGEGAITGDDVDDAGVNTIDYDTGTYDFTFKVAPTDSSFVAVLYRQLLSVNAGDVPLSEDQLAVAGFIDVETQATEA